MATTSEVAPVDIPGRDVDVVAEAVPVTGDVVGRPARDHLHLRADRLRLGGGQGGLGDTDDQGHRPENRPARDLGHHHHGRQGNDKPGAPLVAVMAGAEKNMLVAEIVDGIAMHKEAPMPGGVSQNFRLGARGSVLRSLARRGFKSRDGPEFPGSTS